MQFHDLTPPDTAIGVLEACFGRMLLCAVEPKPRTHMRLLTLSSLVLSTSGLLLAQETVTVPTGPSNADQVFYSLRNGEQATVPLADWDLAFEVPGYTASIRVNTAKGLTVFETDVPFDEWESLNAPDEAGWTLIHNSETDWSLGALNHGRDLSDINNAILGWGRYDPGSHRISGTRLYVIADGQGNYRKLRIDALFSNTYDFTYADLDGSNEVSASLYKLDFMGKNFVYWNMSTGSALDLEPPSVEWDLLFTKYIGFIPTPYGLAGVLQNNNVTVLQVDGVPTEEADPWSGEYMVDINTIGADWKAFNMTSFQYEYAEDRTYFVKDRAGDIWKLVFTGYGGSANGNMTFTKELVSPSSVEEITTSSGFVLFPNPVTTGSAQVLLDLPAPEATITIHDMRGKVVYGERFAGIAPLTIRHLDLGTLGAGAYLVRVEHVHGVVSSKLVVH